jgi:signal transduction histidine kinase
LSATAHTVSNLLTALNLSTGQLLYNNRPEAIQEYVKQTDATINSAISAIQHMTILDKLEKGKIKPSFIRTDITRLLHRVMQSKNYKWPQAKLDLHGRRVVKAADSFFLEIVFNELLDNSCRYLSDSIDLNIDTAGEKTRIQFIDNGEGI